jgi:hypothetical protein
MSRPLARIVMAVAAASLGPHRRMWKLAMEAEFDTAVAAGEELSFAFGCLTTAWRELPLHAAGRLTLASHTFALALVLPVAALLLVGVAAGYPYVDPAYADAIGWYATAGRFVHRLNAGNANAVPLFSLILLLRVAGDLMAAWFAVERDWNRAAAAQCFGAATTVTLALFAGVVVLDERCVVLPVFSFAVELLAIAVLRHCYDDAEEAGSASWAI